MKRLSNYKYKQSGLTLLVDHEEIDNTIFIVSNGRRSVINVRLLGIRDTKYKLESLSDVSNWFARCWMSAYRYIHQRSLSNLEDD